MTTSFDSKKSLLLRIWHWTNLLAIAGLLGTGILRKTFMSWRTNSEIISTKMQAAGTPITPELAKDIAVTIRTPMWENHYIFGFALAILLVVRIGIALMPEQSTTLREFGKAIKVRDFHAIFVKALYVAFYGVTAFMVTTGLLMYFKTELGLSSDFAGTLKDSHEFFLWIIAGFVGLHIVGVFIAELRGDKGLVSRMIHGSPNE